MKLSNLSYLVLSVGVFGLMDVAATTAPAGSDVLSAARSGAHTLSVEGVVLQACADVNGSRDCFELMGVEVLDGQDVAALAFVEEHDEGADQNGRPRHVATYEHVDSQNTHHPDHQVQVVIHHAAPASTVPANGAHPTDATHPAAVVATPEETHPDAAHPAAVAATPEETHSTEDKPASSHAHH